MNLRNILACCLTTVLIFLAACNDDISQIGSSLSKGEVDIIADSTFTLKGKSVYTPVFDSRSTTNLLGRLSTPEYGDIRCTFVAQLLAASSMPIPDSIGVERVDSMKLLLRVKRGSFTGDSLAPQRLTVHRLTKPLPSNISSAFNPEGYYDPQKPLGSRAFTLSALSMNDSIYANASYIDIQVPMPLDLAREIFTKYRTEPELFQWPATFNQWFKGIYIEPTFGRGCLTNIQAADMVTYYNYKTLRTVVEDEKPVQKEVLMKDSVTLMGTAPEVLSSNNIDYKSSDLIRNLVDNGQAVVVSPGGYNVEISFPLPEILGKVKAASNTLSVVSDLQMVIPVKNVSNEFGLTPAPYLLMVRSDKLDEFFAKNLTPDNVSSFWGTYSSTNSNYTFTSMRSYVIDMLAKDEYTSDDFTFTLVPVNITTESDYYTSTVSVTSCSPFMERPTMGIMELENAKIKLVYSTDRIY